PHQVAHPAPLMHLPDARPETIKLPAQLIGFIEQHGRTRQQIEHSPVRSGDRCIELPPWKNSDAARPLRQSLPSIPLSACPTDECESLPAVDPSPESPSAAAAGLHQWDSKTFAMSDRTAGSNRPHPQRIQCAPDAPPPASTHPEFHRAAHTVRASRQRPRTHIPRYSNAPEGYRDRTTRPAAACAPGRCNTPPT